MATTRTYTRTFTFTTVQSPEIRVADSRAPIHVVADDTRYVIDPDLCMDWATRNYAAALVAHVINLHQMVVAGYGEMPDTATIITMVESLRDTVNPNLFYSEMGDTSPSNEWPENWLRAEEDDA
jgi:hypothetical protein